MSDARPVLRRLERLREMTRPNAETTMPDWLHGHNQYERCFFLELEGPAALHCAMCNRDFPAAEGHESDPKQDFVCLDCWMIQWANVAKRTRYLTAKGNRRLTIREARFVIDVLRHGWHTAGSDGNELREASRIIVKLAGYCAFRDYHSANRLYLSLAEHWLGSKEKEETQ